MYVHTFETSLVFYSYLIAVLGVYGPTSAAATATQHD